MTYFFDLCDLVVQWKSPFPIKIRKDSASFLIPDEKAEGLEPDIVFTIRKKQTLDEIPNRAVKIHNRMFYPCADGEETFFLNFEEKYYAKSKIGRNGSCVSVQCNYLEPFKHRLDYSKNAWDHLGLESVLLPFDGLILHCSLVEYSESGILFFGPSGCGKSTQALLWEKHLNALIINGDRAALRRNENGWRAYGLPFSGSSEIYVNKSASVRALIIPQKSEYDELIKLSPSEAFATLIPEISIHYWDISFCERAYQLLEDLISSVPVYLLKCTIDGKSVQKVMNELNLLSEK